MKLGIYTEKEILIMNLKNKFLTKYGLKEKIQVLQKLNKMTGLQKLLKMYGSMKITNNEGKSVLWVWDYKNEKARIKSEMTKEELQQSEKAKWQSLKT